VISQFPYALQQCDDGWRIYELEDLGARTDIICRLIHNTARHDPTLVHDILVEKHDPESRVHIPWLAFTAPTVRLYDTRTNAMAALEAWERTYGWHWQHVEDCRKTMVQARRNHHAAKDSLQLTAKKLSLHGAVPMTVRMGK
jgi:hypothetical protein